MTGVFVGIHFNNKQVHYKTTFFSVSLEQTKAFSMSNQDTEQYREFITKLQREDEPRPAALSNLQNWLLHKTPEEATPSIRNVGISKLIECLNDAYKSQTLPMVCDILKLCFSKIDCGDNIVKCYTSHIMYLLRHEKDCVRRLAIDQVHKTVTSDYHSLPMPKYIDVYVATAQMVADSDIEVAATAVRVTSNLPSEAYPKVLDEMEIALEFDSSSKCNALEVIVNISEKSQEIFKIAAEMNYIHTMVSELHSEDVLYQLNVLQLLSRLAVTPHGLNYLVKNGLLQNIADMIGDVQTKPLGNLLVPGYMKFFGCIAHHYPREIFDKYPVMLNLMFDAFDSVDASSLPVALDTLGFIGTTIEGKLSLVALGSQYTEAVDKVGQLIRNSTTDLKIRALHCIANLISIDKDPNKPEQGPVDHRVTLMTREWFRSMDTSAIDTLYTICRNPFTELKLAGYALLDAVCQHQWGEELVARTAGFIEYLLDRLMDHTKESKEVKFDIIKRLANSPAFDDSTQMRLQTYVEQGPFFAEPAMEVAMMDE